MFASNCTLALGFGFWALDRPDMNLKINLASTAISAILGPWLVREHGLIGAAYALFMASTAVSVVRVLLLRRCLAGRRAPLAMSQSILLQKDAALL